VMSVIKSAAGLPKCRIEACMVLSGDPPAIPTSWRYAEAASARAEADPDSPDHGRASLPICRGGERRRSALGRGGRFAPASVHGVRTDEGSPRGCQAEQAVSLLYAVKEYRAAAAELAGLARDY
jgi:hypothetical protein